MVNKLCICWSNKRNWNVCKNGQIGSKSARNHTLSLILLGRLGATDLIAEKMLAVYGKEISRTPESCD
jgi:hypothetical protein